MGDNNELQQLINENELGIVNNIFETVRIVNPLKKVVLTLEGGCISETNMTCYDFWLHNKQCINCVSMRAYNKKESYAKIEYSPEAIFLVLAMPFTIGDNMVIIELMKDVTKSILFIEKDTGKTQEMNALITNLNTAILKDSLTGIYNRRFIDERLPVDIMKSTLNKQPTSIILSDIDHFKMVNDKHGHVAGDHVLSCVAKQLEILINNSDWVARYGGEEFLVCLIDTKMQAAKAMAEKMRAAIEEMSIEYAGSLIKTTMSFGVCTTTGEDIPMEALIDCADKKMYMAKQNGRNKVVS